MNPEIVRILIGIGKGIVYGAIAAGIGMAKNEPWESIDKQKLAKTVIIGSILGGIAGAGITDAQWDSFAEVGIPAEALKAIVLTAITMFADQAVKVIWRKFVVKAYKAIKAKYA
jgi:hypothetical protein